LVTIPIDKEKIQNITGKVVEQFSGGKSGDDVLLIELGPTNIRCILKIFKNDTVNDTVNDTNKKSEIDQHLTFIELFKGRYVPCPSIYCYGKLTNGMNKSYNYVIMEYSDGPELNEHIANACDDVKQKYTDVNMIQIIMELFYIISKMILNNFTHCDLHSKNIIIVKNKGDNVITLPFSKLFTGKKDYTISKSQYRVHIIDFGISVHGTNKNNKAVRCTKSRDISKALVDLRTKCTGSKYSALMRLIKGELGKSLDYKGNSDLLFFCNILKAIKSSNKDSLHSEWVNTIDIDMIRETAGYILDSTIDNKSDLLKDIYNQLYRNSSMNVKARSKNNSKKMVRKLIITCMSRNSGTKKRTVNYIIN
jgi:serine/threonine protein kinase